MKIFLFFFTGLFLFSCSMHTAKYGVRDDISEERINKANIIISYYKKKDYKAIEKFLQMELRSFLQDGDKYAVQHILNELADIYSFYLFDIEKAIEADKKILDNGIVLNSNSKYFLKARVANDKVITDNSYIEKYLNISSEEIIKKSQSRLTRNKKLLNAEPIESQKKYTLEMLGQHYMLVKEDLNKSFKKNIEWYELISRLIRAEYEIFKISGSLDSIKDGYKYFQSGEIKLEDVSFSEIDFISLSEYLKKAFEKTQDFKLAEYALQSVYKPYVNLRNNENRWMYNKIVNEYINILINANYKTKNYADMLYYISLNKSRMILEDKLRYTTKNLDNNLSSVENQVIDNKTGLPDKNHFLKKLNSVNHFVDFYMEGYYKKTKINHNEFKHFVNDSSLYHFAQRSINIITKDTNSNYYYADIFSTDSLYISYLNNGKIAVIRKDAQEISIIKEKLEGFYNEIMLQITKNRGLKVTNKNTILNKSYPLTQIKLDLVPFTIPHDIYISPDGWLSKYPLNYVLGVKETRILSLFYFSSDMQLSNINIVGYFNPTKDLPEAEDEMQIIKKLYPESILFVRENASIQNLKSDIKRNILHLSMHGLNIEENPAYSKLLLANSKLDDSLDDPNAIYAKDMFEVKQMKDNDLVFTAACETGLIKKSDSNQNEIIGILRPMLVNNNKNIILTLWKVSSESAGEFVKYFYQNLSLTKNVKSAFFYAQDVIKNKYDEPFHWAPYYLIQNY